MKRRLTETRVNNIIRNTIHNILEQVINENDENDLLSRIAERVVMLQDKINWSEGEGEVEVPLDDNGDMIAYIDYEVENNQYSVPGMKSVDRDVPDDDPIVRGDAAVIVKAIVLYDENNQEYQVEDNGMVSDALQSILDPTQLDAPMMDY